MANMDGWSLALLAVAGYVAGTSLIRFMKSQHDALLTQLRNEWRAEQERRAEEERRRRCEERKRRLYEQIQANLEESDKAA